MSIWASCKDAFSQYGTWVGLFFSAVFGVLAYLDRTSQFTMSFVGLHNKFEVLPGQNKEQGEPRVYYTASGYDILTIFAIHIPIFVFFSFIWDNMSKYPAAGARSQFCIYFTTGLMLASCLMLSVVGVFKEGYWDYGLWWSGLPKGEMSWFVKLTFLMQLALLCYYAETLAFGGQSLSSMLDSWIDITLNLAFSLICYLLNFLPLMTVVFTIRCCLHAGVSFVQVLSLLELSGKRRDYTRTFFRVLRWLSGGEVICYVCLIVAILAFGNHGILKKASIIAPLGAMFAIGLFRVASSGKYELDLLRSGDGGQVNAPPAAPVLAAAKSKAKRK